MRKILLLVGLCVVCFANMALATRAIILSNQQEEYTFEHTSLEIFEDTTKQLNFQQISQPSFGKFKIGEDAYPYANNPNAVYWLRVKVHNRSTANKRWVFEVFSHNIQQLSVYIPDQHGNYKETITGQYYHFKQREYHVINPVFDIPSHTNASYFIYLKVQTRNDASFDFHIRTQNFFTKYATKEYWFLGFYYGILSFIILYFFILYITTREKLYIFYIFYLFSCCATSLVDDGVGFEFIWSSTPQVNELLTNYVASTLFLVSFVIYAKFFIGIRDKFPNINLLLLISTAVCLLLQFVQALDEFYTFFYFTPFVLVYWASVKSYLQGEKSSRFFIVGQSLLLLSMIIIRLTWVGVIDATIYTVYSFNICVVLEGLMFSYAFVDRFNLLKKQNDVAQQNIIKQLEENELLQSKVNRELEIKVQERTEELRLESQKLVESNQKLEALMAQVNEMNSKLDYDNWQLNKKVAEQKKARVVSEQMSYEEFTKVYSSDFACMKYLEEVKWANGYACKKCGNTKYIYLQKNLSRRCTKCSYIESATNNTIFQGLKFSISKAFYIVYTCTFDVQELTIDELSELLELRRNTCWSFRKRVLEVKSTIFSNGKLKDKNKFEALILHHEV
jgi:hypothetical protein